MKKVTISSTSHGHSSTTVTPYEYMQQKLSSQGLLLSEIPPEVRQAWRKWQLLDPEVYPAERLWWAGVQCEFPTICSRCQEDLEVYKSLFYEGGERLLLQRYKGGCDKSCFWYQYFLEQRKKIVGKRGFDEIESRSYLRKRGFIK